MQLKMPDICCVCMASIGIQHCLPRTESKPAVVCSSRCVQCFESVYSFLQGFVLCELLHTFLGRPLPFTGEATKDASAIHKEFVGEDGDCLFSENTQKPCLGSSDSEDPSEVSAFAPASACDVQPGIACRKCPSKSFKTRKEKRWLSDNLKNSVKTLDKTDCVPVKCVRQVPPLKKQHTEQMRVTKSIEKLKQKRIRSARKSMRQRKSMKADRDKMTLQTQKDLTWTKCVPVESTDSEGNPGTKQMHMCPMCPKTFIHKCNLRYHIKRMHSGEEPVKCETCGIMLQGSYDLLQHKRRVHESYLVCDICGAQFTTSCGLKSHLEAHAGVKSNFCDICGKGFVRKTSLTQHRLLHVEGKSFLCDMCSQSFKTRSSLSGHLLNVHSCGPYFENRVKSLEKMGYIVDRNAVNRQTRNLCLDCGDRLEDGKCRTHPELVQDSLFKCIKCSPAERDFKDIVAFDIHMKWHNKKVSHSGRKVDCGWKTSGSNKKPLISGEFKCDVCSKVFKSRTYLWAHMNQHKDKRFSCDICGRKFTYKCNLKSHLITHQESRPFECDVCNKAFKMKSLLEAHKILHGAPSPFKCEICGKGLTRKQNLKSHYRIMHPETQQRA